MIGKLGKYYTTKKSKLDIKEKILNLYNDDIKSFAQPIIFINQDILTAVLVGIMLLCAQGFCQFFEINLNSVIKNSLHVNLLLLIIIVHILISVSLGYLSAYVKRAEGLVSLNIKRMRDAYAKNPLDMFGLLNQTGIWKDIDGNEYKIFDQTSYRGIDLVFYVKKNSNFLLSKKVYEQKKFCSKEHFLKTMTFYFKA